ncbi:MAG: hypothetical protein U9R42_00675 [Bacteroidota bacterium]|nr:hypothetical protein [Bacteroidota bacterium]
MIKCSSPYNDTFPQKDNNGIKEVANNKGLSTDISLVVNQDSSPYNDALSPEDREGIRNTVDNNRT